MKLPKKITYEAYRKTRASYLGESPMGLAAIFWESGKQNQKNGTQTKATLVRKTQVWCVKCTIWCVAKSNLLATTLR